ncbi:MAG TPA: hypothetical protein VIF09_06075 [Polyangiaceae bacterium]
MLDLARVVVLFVATAYAVRYRFALGAVAGGILLGALALLFCTTYSAVTHGLVSGEYGFALAYFGPTMVPFSQRSFWQWSPAVVQLGFALVSAIPAAHVLRQPTSPVTTPFLLVFVPSAMFAVIAALAAFLLWHQESSFPEYWQDHF